MGIADVVIGASAWLSEAHGVERAPHIIDLLAEMINLAETCWACSLSCALLGQPTPSGAYVVDPLMANVTKLNITRFTYEWMRLAQDVAGGLIITLPSERDYRNPELRGYMDKYFQGKPGFSAEQRMRMMRLVEALAVGLRRLRAEGMERVWARHRALARGVRAGVEAMGLRLFSERPSDSLTAVTLPEGVDGTALVKKLRDEEGIIIAGGQGKLKGKICRIAHMGYIDSYDCLTALAALERVLVRMGVEVPAGAGVAAAAKVYREEAEVLQAAGSQSG